MKAVIKNLGKPGIPSPCEYENYTNDDTVVLYQTIFNNSGSVSQEILENPLFFEQAGPRESIFFDTKSLNAGIVTCGGLCPGINEVIRGIVMELVYRYKIGGKIYGFRYGFEGLVKKYGHEPEILTPERVAHINHDGGTILSSSRGNQDPAEMADTLEHNKVNILFCIGGDGTLRGAHSIAEEITRRGLKIAVIGIPKTIDNDISYIQKTFGFSTAVSAAVEAIECAHVEAKGGPNTIGLVKLMGRHSGFITVNAALASKNVNYVLIPEQGFDLRGNGGFLENLQERIQNKNHAVVVVAEGAGQDFFNDNNGTDPSGNKKLNDIGVYLRGEIEKYFKEIGMAHNVKYIDPSYIIRSVPANAEDTIFCGFLAQSAVHAAMAGKTDMVVGIWNNVFTHVPIELATSERKILNTTNSFLWRSLLASTGQPNNFKVKTKIM